MLHRFSVGLLASVIALAPLPTRAQDETSKNIGEQLYLAFGNQDFFDPIAIGFLDNANASFSCKWWMMKENYQHQLDFNALKTAPPEVP